MANDQNIRPRQLKLVSGDVIHVDRFFRTDDGCYITGWFDGAHRTDANRKGLMVPDIGNISYYLVDADQLSHKMDAAIAAMKAAAEQEEQA